jgi:hypothetical protein
LHNASDWEAVGLLLDRYKGSFVRDTAFADDNFHSDSKHLVYQIRHRLAVGASSRKGDDSLRPKTDQMLQNGSAKTASPTDHEIRAITLQLGGRWLSGLHLQAGVSKRIFNVLIGLFGVLE